MENFDQPYISRNITEFWTRWHISLSSWFRDYVYIPLGGNRKGTLRRKVNVLIVFLLSGLWHGANFTFVVWGGLHGFLVTLLPNRESRNTKKIGRLLFAVINFLAITVCWVFFRAYTVQKALRFIKGLFYFKGGTASFGMNTTELVFSTILIVVLMAREYWYRRHLIHSDLQFALYISLMIPVCYFFGVFGENQFIYFQF